MYAITNLHNAIANDKKEIAICKGMRICPNCGAEQDKNSLCCTNCGINMSDADRIAIPEAEPVFCKNCGKPVTSNSKFCMNCGAKVGE